MAKKLYQAPLLSVFGSLENLTRSLSVLRRLPQLILPTSQIPSDQNIKEAFTPVDAAAVLNRLAQVPVTSWSYKADHGQVRHIGPMAQDFAAAFGVGADDTKISMVDANGVTFAAIQALYQMLQERDTQIAELRAEIQALKGERQQ